MITVICGCMFAGKSGKLLRLLKRHRLAGRNIQVFKPSLDTRDVADGAVVQTREGGTLPAQSVSSVHAIQDLLLPDTQVIAIDEVQFFDGDLRDSLALAAMALAWSQQGVQVIVAGLDMDYEGVPFDTTAMLLAVAHKIHKMTAVCSDCGEDAPYTRRVDASTERISPGHSYVPVCARHALPFRRAS